MKDQLISEISKQLNIAETAGTESLCKAIYSTTGKMALASIWDHPEDEKFVSIQHFKKRAAQVLGAYLSIYPEAGHRFPLDRSGIIEDNTKPTEGTDFSTIPPIDCILRRQVPEGWDNVLCTGESRPRSHVT